MTKDIDISPELVARYISNRRKDLVAVRKAFADKDYNHLVTVAHNLKGNAESFGFPELGNIGREMEVAALEKDESALEKYIFEIEAWLSNQH